MTNTTALPPRLQAIVEEFQDAEGREKLDLLLDFAASLPPLPDWLAGQHSDMDQVHECMSLSLSTPNDTMGGCSFISTRRQRRPPCAATRR